MIKALTLNEVRISKDHIAYYRCKALVQLEILNAAYAGARNVFIPIRNMEGARQYLDLIHGNLVEAGYRISIHEKDWEVKW